MKKQLLTAGLALAFGAGSGFVLNAYAQAKPEVLVKQRQAAMTLQGKYFGPLAGMAQGKIPYNAEVAARNAGYLSVLDMMPWDGFDSSTKDEKTKALPAVFENPAKFKEAQERLQSAVTKLVSATKADEAAFKAAAGEVGKACGACHESFRAK
jgi:cytochrome c556